MTAVVATATSATVWSKTENKKNTAKLRFQRQAFMQKTKGNIQAHMGGKKNTVGTLMSKLEASH